MKGGGGARVESRAIVIRYIHSPLKGFSNPRGLLWFGLPCFDLLCF